MSNRIVKFAGRFIDLDRIVAISELSSEYVGTNQYAAVVFVYIQLMEKPLTVYLENRPYYYGGISAMTYEDGHKAIACVPPGMVTAYEAFVEAWKTWTENRSFEREDVL